VPTMSFDENGRSEQTFADYLEVLRRYKWLILVAATVVPLVAYVMTARQPNVYRATSEVLLNRQDLGSVLTGLSTTNTYIDPVRYAQTQAALARVPAVTRAAVARAEVTMDASELVGRSVVTPRGSTDLLTFSVEHGDPDLAARLSSAYATAFTVYKHRTETASVARARKELQARLAELRRDDATGTATYRDLVRKSQDLRTLELLQAPATVVRAAAGAGKVEPAPTRSAMLGGVLGLILGLGAAFGLNAVDRRIRTAEEVERELRVPLLGRLPGPRSRRDDLLILDRPADEVSEAVSRLRANFDFANSHLHAKVIMVTSAGAREGKSTTAANLALALSRTGRHVILLDLDLRRPTLGQTFHLRNGVGVTDVANGVADLDSAIAAIAHAPTRSWPPALAEAESGVGLLEVLTAGRTRVDPSEFVETPGLAEVLHRLRARGDLVLVDASPILAAGDAVALTAKVDAIMLVNRLGTLTQPAARELGRVLDRSPAPTLGFVATGAPVGGSYYGYRPPEERPSGELARLPKPSSQRASSQELASAPASARGGRWSQPPSGR
jgi:polysaccharide biosynthesis transport protein